MRLLSWVGVVALAFLPGTVILAAPIAAPASVPPTAAANSAAASPAVAAPAPAAVSTPPATAASSAVPAPAAVAIPSAVRGPGSTPLIPAAPASTAASTAVTQADSVFLAARSAYERGDRLALEALAPRLGGHPLLAYVEFWRLMAGIDTAGDDDVHAFLERYPASVLADRLRVEWLKSLARRGQWERFGAQDATQPGDDVELTCFRVQYRRQRDGDAALLAAKPLWFTGQTLPDACEAVFATLIARDEITVADRRQRFRLATEAANVRLAKAIGDALPGEERIAARELAAVERDPARALAKGNFHWNTRAGRELALFALERAARRDALGVRAAWERQRPRLPKAERLYGNARLAYQAARQLLPQANEWYREAVGAPLDDTQLAWQVRAALRAGDWPGVNSAIDAMPPSLAQDPAWRYWKARALAAAGRDAEARALYTALASAHHFYALLAAEALGKGADKMRAPPPPAANPDPAAAAAMAAFAIRPEVARAVKLAELGLRAESQREWYYAVRDLDDTGLLAAAEYARRLKLWDRAINTAERTSGQHDFALRYLTPYREDFAAAARSQAVDEALLFGLARQESRFNAGIVSSAGAMGLMQLMPATARWVAKHAGRPDYKARDITDVALNTEFGAFYFKYWLDRLERLPALAAAAYNAGPQRAQAWRAAAPLEGAIWVETIPFNETRDYVKKVLANAMFYARELEQPYVPLSTRLGIVPPRDSLAGEAR